jgi:exosortase
MMGAVTGTQTLPSPARLSWFHSRYALLIVLSILLVLCYLGTFAETAAVIQGSEDMSQAYMAPVIACIVAWDKRHLLFLREYGTSVWGVVIVAAGAAMGLIASAGASGTLGRAAFVTSLAGCIVTVGGWMTLRRLSFAFLMLAFLFPLPPLLYDEVTMPLRMMASYVAEVMLESTGYTVFRQGNVIELRHITLSVVDACSGLRSLLALTFLALTYGYFLERRRSVRALLAVSAIPVAILVNALRVTATGVLSVYSSGWAHGTPHDMLGWGGLGVGFAVLMLLHKTMNLRVPQTRPA